jgi:hypothetical protein
MNTNKMFQKLVKFMPRFYPTPVLLGRWCRTDKPLNDIKVDLANMDHCGTCNHDKIKETPIYLEPKKEKTFAYPKQDGRNH